MRATFDCLFHTPTEYTPMLPPASTDTLIDCRTFLACINTDRRGGKTSARSNVRCSLAPAAYRAGRPTVPNVTPLFAYFVFTAPYLQPYPLFQQRVGAIFVEHDDAAR